jgi:hypothetical protein
MSMPSLLLAAALDAALPSTHLALTFGPSTPLPALPPAVITTAVREAAAIWSPYRVVVDQALPCASAPDEAIVLTVVTGATPRGGAGLQRGAIGAIEFFEDGTAEGVLTVFFDLLRRFVMGFRLGDVSSDRWPPAMRERILGRGLGRVIAHEIGHYLLGSRGHSAAGLMRALQRTDELFGPGQNGYRLTASDVRRLALRSG